MKKVKLLLLMITIGLCSVGLKSQVSLNLNIGTPRYYYLQDIEVYYDNQTSMYVYPSGGRWIRARTLPPSYGVYDFNNSHRVVINDYRGTRPYRYYDEHKQRFPKGRYDKPENNHWSTKDHHPEKREMKNGDRNNNGGKNPNGNGRKR